MKSTKRCGLDRLNLFYTKRNLVHPVHGLIHYQRLKRDKNFKANFSSLHAAQLTC
jgi:hypothetical protein